MSYEFQPLIGGRYIYTNPAGDESLVLVVNNKLPSEGRAKRVEVCFWNTSQKRWSPKPYTVLQDRLRFATNEELESSKGAPAPKPQGLPPMGALGEEGAILTTDELKFGLITVKMDKGREFLPTDKQEELAALRIENGALKTENERLTKELDRLHERLVSVALVYLMEGENESERDPGGEAVPPLVPQESVVGHGGGEGS